MGRPEASSTPIEWPIYTLVTTMNAKLNAVMDAEFGKDDGREMPEVAGVNWAVDRVEL